MAFPTAGLVDDFNRANTGPPPSGSWSNDAEGQGVSGLKVVSNQLVASANFATGYWSAGTFGPDSEVYIQAITVGAIKLYLRLATPGTATADGYIVQQSSTTLAFYRMDNGIPTQLGSTPTVTALSANDQFGGDMVGSTLTAYSNLGGAGWASLDTRSDATYSAAGNIGAGISSTASAWDNFSGGTIAAGAAPVLARPFDAIPFMGGVT